MKVKIFGILSLAILLVIFGRSVAFAQTPEEIAKKYGITFPIAELGGCVDYSSCRTYCEDPVNHSLCMDFAKKKGFHKEETIQTKNRFIDSAKRELGCDSESSCREFCGNQANWEKCGEFAKKHKLNGGHTEDPKKAEILEKAKIELGCYSYESCMAFCRDESNAQKCSEFAKKVGLRGGEVHAGPGGCTSEETCHKFCSDPNNFEICNKYTGSNGGKFHGPGGCDNETSCKAYCQINQQECGSFGQTAKYDSLMEMCSRTPNCSWTDNNCECHSQGKEMPAAGYEQYCKEFPGKCANLNQKIDNTQEEYCKRFPDRCPNEPLHPLPSGSFGYPLEPSDKNHYDPAAKCATYGCTWTGTSCQCSEVKESSIPIPTYSSQPVTETPTTNIPTPTLVNHYIK
jgi:hypothetical protein